MGDIAPAFPPSFPQILVLADSIGNLAPSSLEHNEKLIMMWLARVAPAQNFDELGRKKTIIDSSMIDPKTRKPIPQITLIKVEDVRKVAMLFSLLLSDVKVKFNGCAHELTRLHGSMTIEQMRAAYPETVDKVLEKMMKAGKDAIALAEKEKQAAANEETGATEGEADKSEKNAEGPADTNSISNPPAEIIPSPTGNPDEQ